MVQEKFHSFKDLEVYRSSYQACLAVMRVIAKLPASEKFDLRDQLSRSSKAIPRLIAEGYAKKHQKAGFQKYLDDALAEANETIVGLEQCRDIYNVEPVLCGELVETYDKIARQIYNLALAWNKFKSRQTKPSDDTRGETQTSNETSS